jgi:hypothetical protein
MDHKISAVERAFQMAKAGQALIKAAHLEITNSAKR